MKRRRFTAWVLTAAMILTQGLGSANLTLAAESGSEEQAVVAVSEDTENETSGGYLLRILRKRRAQTPRMRALRRTGRKRLRP